MVAQHIKRNGYSRNDVLKILYGMQKPIQEKSLDASNTGCMFDRTPDSIGISQGSARLRLRPILVEV